MSLDTFPGRNVSRDGINHSFIFIQPPALYVKGTVRANAYAHAAPVAVGWGDNRSLDRPSILSKRFQCDSLLLRTNLYTLAAALAPAGIHAGGLRYHGMAALISALANGDIITGVNGQTIASVDDAMKAFGTLSTEAPVQVKVKRRGQEETLEYKIE